MFLLSLASRYHRITFFWEDFKVQMWVARSNFWVEVEVLRTCEFWETNSKVLGLGFFSNIYQEVISVGTIHFVISPVWVRGSQGGDYISLLQLGEGFLAHIVWAIFLFKSLAFLVNFPFDTLHSVTGQPFKCWGLRGLVFQSNPFLLGIGI